MARRNLKNTKDIININKETDLYFSELIKAQTEEKNKLKNLYS